MAGMKKCSKCQEFFPSTLEFFCKRAKSLDGMDSWCKECNKENNKRWRQENPEKQTELNKIKYYNDKEQNNAKSREWYKNNREWVSERNRIWRKNNPDKARINNVNIKAKIRNAVGKHTIQDIRKLLVDQDYKCKYCNCNISNGYHIDHIIPISKGGSNWPENLCISCAKCNLSKNDKMPDEWEKYRKEILCQV